MSHQRETSATHERTLFSQHENSAITYTVNWIPRLDGDTIATSTWTQETTGATLANESNTDYKTSVRLSGTPGRYLFTNKITTTTSGDTMEYQFQLIVKDNDEGFNLDYYNARDYV